MKEPRANLGRAAESGEVRLHLLTGEAWPAGEATSMICGWAGPFRPEAERPPAACSSYRCPCSARDWWRVSASRLTTAKTPSRGGAVEDARSRRCQQIPWPRRLGTRWAIHLTAPVRMAS
jgi:hypothetical protein